MPKGVSFGYCIRGCETNIEDNHFYKKNNIEETTEKQEIKRGTTRGEKKLTSNRAGRGGARGVCKNHEIKKLPRKKIFVLKNT